MLRAVIYARCSTEEESQKDALKKQREEGIACVREKGWQLAGVYVESRSGTTTKGREEYNRLYEELLTDKFDVIVIKSQDRLMRNTKDWYLFVDRMTREQKRLYMYIEQKFYSPEDALITGIKAILAEEYSRELSKKINLAHRNRQKQNGTVILTSNTYGFRRLPDKSVVLVEEEAAVKRRMYELCAAGFGSRKIAAILTGEGIRNRNGNPFTDSAILRILRSPLNKGTAVMNRVHFDFDTKKRLKVPKEEQYVYENKVPRTVSDDLWEAANREIDRRAERTKGERRGKNPGRYHLSSKIYCGLCGSPYYRRTRKRPDGQGTIHEWKCKRYLEKGRSGCANVHLEEESLYEFLENVCKERYSFNRKQVTSTMLRLLKQVLLGTGYREEIERVQRDSERRKAQMDLLVDKLLEGVISDESYRRKQCELEQEQGRLDERLQRLKSGKTEDGGRKEKEERIKAIERALLDRELPEKAAAACMLEKLDKIWVYPESMELQFHTGNFVWVESGSRFDPQKRKQEEYGRILELMRENPRITAKEIADGWGKSLPWVNYKLRVLKKAKRIQFIGSGGRGRWEVL